MSSCLRVSRALPSEGMSRRLVALAATVALILSLSVAGPARAQDAFRFSTIEVQGNILIPDATILSTAGIAPDTALGAAQLNDGLRRLQASGLFSSVELLPRDGVLLIAVEEYPTINRISIEGNDRLTDDILLGLVQSEPRRAYSPTVAERDANAIADAYRAGGRLTATVTPQIIRRDDNRVDLVFEVAEGRVIETERIAFVGNRAFSDRRLRRVLESTQAGIFRTIIQRDTFIADRIALDRRLLTDFYLDRGHVDFQILSVTPELSRDRGAYFVTFNIREGQSFDLGEITTVSELPGVEAAPFQDVVRLRSGMTYSPRIVDATISRMENFATNQGLRLVRIEPRITRNDAAQTLDVEFVISRGERVFVERIDIEGNATTLDRVIRRHFDTVEGDLFDPRAIRQAAERIRATGFFANVAVDGREGSAPDQVIVDVDVEEQPTGSLGLAGTYSSDDGFGLGLTFAERNFLGRGQALDFAFNTTRGSRAFDLGFTEPAFLRRDLRFGVNVFYTETSSQNRAYDTTDTGVTTSLGFPIGEFNRTRLTFGFDNKTLSDLGDDTSPIIAQDEGDRSATYLGLRYARDTRDVGLDPNAGLRLQFDVEYAGLVGDADYLRATALVIAERKVAREEVTLQAAFEVGALQALSGNSHVLDRFFLSSSQMRGFDTFGVGPRDTVSEDALGGNYFAVARFEAQFPLGLPDEYGLTAGVFADIGTVWGLDDTAGAIGEAGTSNRCGEGRDDAIITPSDPTACRVDDSLRLRTAIGLSLLWDTAIGPLRFNSSRALKTEPYDRTRGFDFTVEARF